MFGLQKEDIKRLYLENKGSPTFVVNFNRKLGQRIKTVSRKGSIDFLRLTRELEHIAKISKQRGYKTKQYLEAITEYANAVAEGNHKKMIFEEDSLSLKPLVNE